MRAQSFALLVFLAATGCIVLSKPAPTGDHCSFRGEEGLCGSCLLRACAAELNAACSDEAIMAPVETCAAVGDESCKHVPDSPVATCIKGICRAVCFTRVGVSLTECHGASFAPSRACVCETSGTNDAICGTSTFSNTRCCAPAGWPGAALKCACNAVACVPSSDGCVCTLTDDLDDTTANWCTGPHCCAVDDRCQCRLRPCSGGEREVAKCGLDALTCPRGTSEVAECSIRQ